MERPSATTSGASGGGYQLSEPVSGTLTSGGVARPRTPLNYAGFSGFRCDLRRGNFIRLMDVVSLKDGRRASVF